MRKMLAVACLAVLAPGCGDGRWDDVPGAIVTPVALVPGAGAAWEREVGSAVDEWADALPVECVAPFILGPGGSEIVLVPLERWEHDPRLAGVLFEGDLLTDPRIDVRLDDAETMHGTLLHEMGHALGLDHSDSTDSVMNAKAYTNLLGPGDADAAACVLGCGPC